MDDVPDIAVGLEQSAGGRVVTELGDEFRCDWCREFSAEGVTLGGDSGWSEWVCMSCCRQGYVTESSALREDES